MSRTGDRLDSTGDLGLDRLLDGASALSVLHRIEVQIATLVGVAEMQQKLLRVSMWALAGLAGVNGIQFAQLLGGP